LSFDYRSYLLFKVHDHHRPREYGMERKSFTLSKLNEQSEMCTIVRLRSVESAQRTLCYLVILRKEVIQPHLPIRLPGYDFTPIIGPAFGSSLLAVGSLTSGVTDSHGVTGDEYKTQERIHRNILIDDY